LLFLTLSGCAGASPLLHPAHVLTPGRVQVLGGVAGRLAALDASGLASSSGGVLEDVAVAPGMAPFVGARVGIDGDNEAGLTYTGRAVRLDARHAFALGKSWRLSLGAGGSALVPRPRGGDADLGSVYGGGGDVPVLVGWSSDADIYAVWLGPRGGFELLRGRILETELGVGEATTPDFLDVSGTHAFVGGLLGVRVGFRSIHVALEVDVTYHRAWGTLGASEVEVEQLGIAPGSALSLTF
jgi:hypothetical protein